VKESYKQFILVAALAILALQVAVPRSRRLRRRHHHRHRLRPLRRSRESGCGCRLANRLNLLGAPKTPTTFTLEGIGQSGC